MPPPPTTSIPPSVGLSSRLRLLGECYYSITLHLDNIASPPQIGPEQKEGDKEWGRGRRKRTGGRRGRGADIEVQAESFLEK